MSTLILHWFAISLEANHDIDYAISIQLSYPFVPTTFPTTVHASDDLQITVHLHEFFLGDRQRACWTYITHGLSQFCQQEMSLSLLLEDDDEPENYPQTPIKIFQLLSDYANQGRTVSAGEATKLGTTGLFGFTVLFYLPAVQYETLPAADDHLALMLIHQDEYDFARRYGLARLVSRISKLCSCFPYPTWNTRQRPSLFAANHGEDSILSDGHESLNVSRALLRGEQLTLWINLAHQKRLKTLQGALILLCETTSDADAALHWDATSSGAVTLSAAPTDISLSFVQFRKAEISSLALVEDGAIVSLNPDDLVKLTSIATSQTINAQLAVNIDANLKHTTPTYNVGAGWIEPSLMNTVVLERIVGNILFSGISLTPLPADYQNLVMLASRVQDTLAEVMSEETESFQMLLASDGERLSLQGDIDFNPEFVTFIRNSLVSMDLSDLRRASLSFSVNPSPQTTA